VSIHLAKNTSEWQIGEREIARRGCLRHLLFAIFHRAGANGPVRHHELVFGIGASVDTTNGDQSRPQSGN
jgi:hypothetical protein